jgi:hypothetical protein
VRWFKHDADAHTDAKLRKLLLAHGPAGYGLYWYCLELIAKEVNEHNLTFQLEEDSELISMGFGMPREQVEAAMKTMVQLGLFSASHGRIACLKLLKRVDASMLPKGDMRVRLQELKDGEPWSNHGQTMAEPWLNHVNQINNQPNNNTGATAPVSGNTFTPPSSQEVEEYIKEKGYHFTSEEFLGYYESQGWRKANGQRITSWKGCCATFEANWRKRNPVKSSEVEL